MYYYNCHLRQKTYGIAIVGHIVHAGKPQGILAYGQVMQGNFPMAAVLKFIS